MYWAKTVQSNCLSKTRKEQKKGEWLLDVISSIQVQVEEHAANNTTPKHFFYNRYYREGLRNNKRKNQDRERRNVES